MTDTAAETSADRLADEYVSLGGLRWAYLSAFGMILLLAIVAQGTIQYALSQEGRSRQAATILSEQTVRSQRLQRNALLLLIPGSHTSIIHQMQSDLTGMEHAHTLFALEYRTAYPSIAAIDGGHGHADEVYLQVQLAAQRLLVINASQVSTARKRAQEQPEIAIMFFQGNEQLDNIVAARHIIDDDTDYDLRTIQRIELGLFALTCLVLLFEIVFVIRPALMRFTVVERTYRTYQEQPTPSAPPTPPTPPPSSSPPPV